MTVLQKGCRNIDAQSLWNIETHDNLSPIFSKGHRSGESYATEKLDSPTMKFSPKFSIGQETKEFSLPEGAAAAHDHLLETGLLSLSDRFVLFNTGSGLKYTDVTAEATKLRRPEFRSVVV